ncbi:hypothetical protein E4U10_003579 [Claviceps purpurea]|nr:hypothetical protein E4U10_003579 [Claviceps purpurea]
MESHFKNKKDLKKEEKPHDPPLTVIDDDVNGNGDENGTRQDPCHNFAGETSQFMSGRPRRLVF